MQVFLVCKKVAMLDFDCHNVVVSDWFDRLFFWSDDFHRVG